jgi:hypothetical protein
MRTALTFCLVPIAIFVAAAALVGSFRGARLQELHADLLRQRGSTRVQPVERARFPLLSEEVRQAATRVPPENAIQPPIPLFAQGEWTPSVAWRNEGRATARATVGTFLWAAAGGDLRVLQGILEFDEVSRRKAGELFAQLPPAVRNYYASGEDVVAGVTMKNVPITKAQLMWLHQADADHAVAGLRLTSPEPQPDAVPTEPRNVPAAPPQLPDRGAQKIVVLSLHRTDAGWRVVIPASAVDRVAGELMASPVKL